MKKTFEGSLSAEGLKFGLVVGRFNDFITRQLLEGALAGLRRHGADMEQVEIAWTPGAFEIPLVARRMAAKRGCDAVIALGAVIRGGTPHFDYVCNESAKGIAQAAWETDVPVLFGILTVDTIEQAVERAGTKAGNKGWDAALAAIEMANLMRLLGE